MNNWWQNLNLTSQERKFVIGVAIVFALVLNFLFIWPQFGKWSPVLVERADKQAMLDKYQKTIEQMPKLREQLNNLETNSAAVIVSSDAKTHFRRTVENLAQQHRFYWDSMSQPNVNLNSTNKYFQEITMRVNFKDTEEKNLVNFMYKLSDGNSSIRVRDFDLKPNNPPMLLQGYLTLVANYEMETPTRSAGSTSTPLNAKTP